jgi:hypothetical protein
MHYLPRAVVGSQPPRNLDHYSPPLNFKKINADKKYPESNN